MLNWTWVGRCRLLLWFALPLGACAENLQQEAPAGGSDSNVGGQTGVGGSAASASQGGASSSGGSSEIAGTSAEASRSAGTAGLGSAVASVPDTPITHATGPADVLIKVTKRGSHTMYDWGWGVLERTQFLLNGDGRLYFYPASVNSLSGVEAARLDESGIQSLLNLAANASLLGVTATYWPTTRMADVPTEHLDIVVDGQTSRVTSDPAVWSSLDSEYTSDGSNFAVLREYLHSLAHVDEWLDATHTIASFAEWPLERVQVTSGPSVLPAAYGGTCTWPLSTAFSSLPEVKLAGSNTNVRCKILSGSELTAFVASYSSQECTKLLDGTTETLVHVRALFPAEAGECVE